MNKKKDAKAKCLLRFVTILTNKCSRILQQMQVSDTKWKM